MPWSGLVRPSRRSLFLAIAVLITSSAGLGTARGAQLQSASFSLKGSNGFGVDVVSEAGEVTVIASEGRPPVATFGPAGRPRSAGTGNGASSVYSAPAEGAGAGIVDADLGDLGSIAVRFRSTGRRIVTTARGVCGRPLRVVRRLGVFVGTIRFQGEDGYTTVAASTARGSVGTPLPSHCPPAPAAFGLAVKPSSLQRRPTTTASLVAVDSRSGSRFRATTGAVGVGFRAQVEERNADGVSVVRRAQAGAPLAAFDCDRSLSWAKVTPPAPFSGSAGYIAGPGARWTGTLRVTFPGLSVPLTGPGFRTSLGRP